MPNKTIYVRDSDLGLWEAAQAELGESISALFAQFLRERLRMMDTFVHVLHSTRPGSADEGEFAVMFAPTGPTGTGGAMKPHYVRGSKQLVKFLEEIGLTHNAAAKIESDLKKDASVSIRTTLPRSVTRTEYYRVRFTPTFLGGDAADKKLLKVEVIGMPISGSRNHWKATFPVLDDLLAALENKLGLPGPQLRAIRQSLLSGRVTELGGVTGAPYSVPEETLIELGMVETGPS